MAVVKQNTVSSFKNYNVTALQWNHTVQSGSDLCLIVAVSIDALAQYPSSVTYNGVSMTLIANQTCIAYGCTSVWKLVNPPVGTYQVSVNFASAAYAGAGAVSFANVHQTTPTANITQDTFPDSYANVTIDITTVTDDYAFAVLGMNHNISGANGCAISQGTSDWLLDSFGGGSECTGGAADRIATSATTTIAWTHAEASGSYIGFAIKFISGGEPPPPQSYYTHFSLTENPMSEGNSYWQGQVDGLDWFNVRTDGTHAHGTTTTGQYTDPMAILKGSWAADQTTQATVFSQNQGETYNQEVELRLRNTISAHAVYGYEVCFRCLKTGAAYCAIGLWNGIPANVTTILTYYGAQYGVQNGDVVKATIVGNVITGYINGVEVISIVDNTYATGNPGLAFNYGCADTYDDFGFTDFLAYEGDEAPSTESVTLGTIPTVTLGTTPTATLGG